MLVLSRQRDQTIMIGDDIEITVVDIRGDKVRLGINAPKWVQVHRKEVYDAIKSENLRASQVQPDDLSGAEPPAGKDRGRRENGPGGRRPGADDRSDNGGRNREGESGDAGRKREDRGGGDTGDEGSAPRS